MIFLFLLDYLTAEYGQHDRYRRFHPCSVTRLTLTHGARRWYGLPQSGLTQYNDPDLNSQDSCGP
jgi:hypothetical protein